MSLMFNTTTPSTNRWAEKKGDAVVCYEVVADARGRQKIVEYPNVPDGRRFVRPFSGEAGETIMHPARLLSLAYRSPDMVRTREGEVVGKNEPNEPRWVKHGNIVVGFKKLANKRELRMRGVAG